MGWLGAVAGGELNFQCLPIYAFEFGSMCPWYLFKA